MFVVHPLSERGSCGGLVSHVSTCPSTLSPSPELPKMTAHVEMAGSLTEVEVVVLGIADNQETDNGVNDGCFPPVSALPLFCHIVPHNIPSFHRDSCRYLGSKGVTYA